MGDTEDDPEADADEHLAIFAPTEGVSDTDLPHRPRERPRPGARPDATPDETGIYLGQWGSGRGGSRELLRFAQSELGAATPVRPLALRR